MEFWEVPLGAGTFHGYCGRLDAWAGGAQHVVTGLGLTLTLYKPHYPIFFVFSFLFFFTLCLVFRTQLMLSNSCYFCLLESSQADLLIRRTFKPSSKPSPCHVSSH